MKIVYRSALYFVLALLSTANAWAIYYYAGRPGASGDEKKMKWSTCKWYGNPAHKSDPLPNKPGVADEVVLRWDRYYLEVDSDVNVFRLDVGSQSHLFCEGRNVKMKRSLSMTIPPNTKAPTIMHFKKSKLDVGGAFEVGFWQHSLGAGVASAIFEDCSAEIKSGFHVIIPYNGRFKNKTPQGFEFILKGNTNLNFGGGAIIDSLIVDSPKEWFLKMKFEDKNGAFPTISFNDECELAGIDIEVSAGKDLKSGKFALINLNNRKSGISPRSISINGKKCSLGESVKVGDKTLVLSLDPSPRGKDSRTKNDLVLTVK